MKGKIKRTLSVIIALAMIISLLPTVAFAAPAENIVLNFNSSTVTPSKVVPAEWTVAADAGWSVDAELSRSNAAFSTAAAGENYLQVDLRGTSTNFTPWWRYGSSSKNNSINAKKMTLGFKVANVTAGYYRVRFTGGKYSSGGKIFVYVGEQLAGTYDCYDEAATTPTVAEEVVFNTLYLTPEADGAVRIRLNVAESADNQRTYAVLSKITLEPLGTDKPDSAKVKSVSVTAPKKFLPGTAANIGAYVEMQDGSYRYFNGMVRSTKEDYIHASTTDADNFIDVAVSDGTFTPSYYSDNSATKSGIFTSPNGKAEGSFLAEVSGNYTVTVSGKINGEEFSGEKILSVEETGEQEKLILKFNSSKVEEINKVTPADWVVSDTAGWTVDADNSCEIAYITSNTYVYDDAMTLGVAQNSKSWLPWHYFSTGTNNNAKARRATFTAKTTADITEGWYSVKLRGARLSGAGRYFVFVDDQYAGVYDSYDAAATGVVPDAEFTTLNTLYLTPETDELDPYVRVRLVNAEPDANNRPIIGISEIALEPLGTDEPQGLALSDVELTAPAKIMAGTTVPVEAALKLGDGSVGYIMGLKYETTGSYTFCAVKDNDDYVNITASDNATLTPSYMSANASFNDRVFVDADGKIHASLYAAEPCDVTLTISGKYRGEAFSFEKTVTFEARPERKTVTAYFNNKNITGLDKAPSEWVINDGAYYVDAASSRTTLFSQTATDELISLSLNGTSSNKSPWWMFGNTSTNNNINARKSILAVKIKNVYEGWYTVKLRGGKISDGARYFLYVNQQLAGTYDSYSGNTTTNAAVPGDEITLNRIYITPETDANGDSVAELRINLAEPAENDRHKGVISSVTLEPIESGAELAKVNVTSDDKLVAGADLALKISVEMDDGSLRYINGLVSDFGSDKFALCSKPDADNFIKVSVSDNATFTPAFYSTNSATVNGLFAEADGTYRGTLYAEDEGTVTVTVSGKLSGKEFTHLEEIRIAPAPKLNLVEVKAEKYEIPASRTAATSIVLTREDGSPYKDDYTVEYKSSDEAVATVDENGVIKGVEEGEATITATVSAKYGAIVSGKVDIVITERPILSSLAASAKRPKLIVDSSTEIALTGAMNDGVDAAIGDYEFIFESLNPEIVEVTEDGVATAVAIGSAMILVRTKNELGIEVSTTLKLDVYEDIPATVIDFKLTETDGTTYPPKSTTGYTIIEEKSATSTYRKDTYPEIRKKLLRVATRGSSNRFWPISTAGKGCMFTIEVYVPFESDYQIFFEGGMNYCGGMYSLFADDRYLGDYNCYAEGDGWRVGENKQLNTVHLTEGNHEISFRVRWSDYSTPYLMLNVLKLQPVGGEVGLSDIEIGEVPEIMAVGEKFFGKAIARMNDGSAYNFGVTNEGKEDTENTIGATVDGAGITFSDFVPYTIGKTGSNDYTVTATEAGSATITFEATVGGKTETKSATIFVQKDDIKTTTATTEAEEVFAGDSTVIIPETTLESGRIINNKSTTNVYTSENPEIATVEGDVLTAHAVGEARIKVDTSFNGKTVTGYFTVNVLPEGMTEIIVTAGGSPRIRWTDEPDANVEDYLVPMYVEAISNEGRELDMSDAEITAESLTPELATVDVNGVITPVYADPELGSEARFLVTVKLDGRIRTVEAPLTILCAKTEATYYTAEEVAAVRANYSKFDWVKKTADSQFDAAERYYEHLDEIYMMIPSEGIPRGTHVGSNSDPDALICRYCGTDLLDEFGGNPWKHNPFATPWKIMCPKCERRFPTNDFEKFYELGLNEYREYDRSRALEAHHRMIHHGDKDAECSCTSPTDEFTREWLEYYGYGADGGYLTNKLYNNLETVRTLNAGRGLRDGETTATWGVDDGMGYIPRKPDGTPYAYDNGVVERHTYIAEYMHSGIWRKMSDANGGVILEAIKRGSNAYYYTGEKKYGRMAAILLDRVADFYSDYDIGQYGSLVQNSHGGAQKGNIVGRIWDCGQSSTLMSAYDMVYDLYDDPFVINFINEKEKTIKMRYAKETGNQIRQNIEDRMIRNMLDSLVSADLYGNFGYPQGVNVRAAVTLDSFPETKYWLDYLMAAGHSSAAPSLGGGIYEHLVNEVDADGQGDEGSSYNTIWISSLVSLNEALEDYKGYQAANFYNHPKFVRMLYSNIEMSAGAYTPNVGDSSATARPDHWMDPDVAKNAWKNLRDPVFAQMLYMLNGNSSKGLHYGETDSNPNRLEKEVQSVIDEYGTYKPESHAMTTFAYGVLHDGGDYTDVTTPTAQDTRRNVWMWWGSSNSHGHNDTMNLGMTAFGLNFMPELAYPEQTSTQPNRLQWISTTLAHNTVMVNRKTQSKDNEYRGKLLHFDDAGAVGVMDVESENVYASTDSYRRSLVYIKVNDEVSYAVDFFRVLGGWSHLYSFHAQSNEITDIKGFGDCTPQVDENGNYVGSYAGAEVPFGQDPNSPPEWSYETVYPRGYTWLENIDRYNNPTEKLEANFKITDFRKVLRDSSGLNLYMTMLNGTNMEKGAKVDVSIVDGYPPRKAENKMIDKFKYLLVRNEGPEDGKLDTTFTTVFEPYRNTRYIESVDELEMKAVAGKELSGNAARAVMVKHVDGRIDYILYATNNSVTYEIEMADGAPLRFRGFVGVWTVQNGKNTYKYISDGDILGEETGAEVVFKGVVRSFTKEIGDYGENPDFTNEITVVPNASVSDELLSDLAGRYLIVDNGAQGRSGSYKIEGVRRDGDNVVFDVGRVTSIRSYVDAMDPSLGFTYTISEGQSARVPLSYYEDNAPEFDAVADSLSTSAGSTISVKLNATSPLDEAITYKSEMLPRGASFDSETGTVTWKPTSSQIGDNHFAITAIDESGRKSTVHFIVSVYGSTGGAGGGGSTTPSTPTDTPTIPTTPGVTDKPAGSTDNVGTDLPGGPQTPSTDKTDSNARFIDLGNYSWAADAINSLADEGIIKGTSENTFSPAANITRADFAILLVRAFKLASENEENFADVSSSDYFAKELAVARNTGLVNGIGDNKFAPRNNISRQDMMVIVYRALVAMEKITAAENTPSASDFDTVADYAKEAVSALVNAKLVNGKNGLIAPIDHTTRAEVAVLIKRILDFIK